MSGETAQDPRYPGPGGFIPDLLHRAAAAFETEFQPVLRRRRLIPSAWRVLAALADQDGQAVGELALRTATDQTTLSRVIMRMEGRSLVQRRRRTQDSRFIDVFLLPQGRKLFGELLPAAVGLSERVLAGLSPLEHEVLAATLRKILAGTPPAAP